MIKNQSIVGHFGTYEDAYNAIGKKFKESGQYSIQRSKGAAFHPWVLIYYGNFYVKEI